MTDKLRELLEDVQTVYEGKGMVVHPNSFNRLRMEVIKLDNINRLQNEQIKKMKCCNNCKHKNLNWSFQPICTVRKNDDRDIENPITCKCEKWEVAE